MSVRYRRLLAPLRHLGLRPCWRVRTLGRAADRHAPAWRLCHALTAQTQPARPDRRAPARARGATIESRRARHARRHAHPRPQALPLRRARRGAAARLARGGGGAPPVHTGPLVEVERVAVGRVLILVLLGALHRLLELLFEEALAVFDRAQLLREDLFAQVLLALHLLRHLLKGGERLRLLLMRDDDARLRVHDDGRLATRADDSPALRSEE